MGIPRQTRVVATIPPSNWFGGYDRTAATPLLEHLERRFGMEFYQLDTTPWTFDDKVTQQRYVEELREYKPDIAISLINAGYGFLASDKTDGGARNLFTDILGIPLIMPWDHGLFQFPSLLPHHYPDSKSEGGNIRSRVRAVIDHPLMHHIPIDSGQVSVMRRMGMMTTTNNVTIAPAGAYMPYLDFGRCNERLTTTDRLAFVGNIYAGATEEKAADSELERHIQDTVIHAKRSEPLANSWALLTKALAGISESKRTAHQLNFDHSHFWKLADNLIARSCNMVARSEVLRSISHDVALYGEFVAGSSVDGLKRFPNVRYRGFVDFAQDLPATYARAEILVDIGNAAFIANCSSKPICCLAAGGFPLFDYKEDVTSYLGQDANLLMYRTIDELNSKIDYYLTHSSERLELAASLKEEVRRNCDYANIIYNVAERMLSESASNRESPGAPMDYPVVPPSKVLGIREDPGPNAVELVTFSLPTDISIPVGWTGAQLFSNDPTVIQTAEAAWGYSAYIDLQALELPPATLGRYWFAIDCRCIKGECSFSLMYGDQLLSERPLRQSDENSVIYFRIQFRKGLTGIMLRSHGEGLSHVQVGSIKLLSEGISP